MRLSFTFVLAQLRREPKTPGSEPISQDVTQRGTPQQRRRENVKEPVRATHFQGLLDAIPESLPIDIISE
jgi:hypothetical protein